LLDDVLASYVDKPGKETRAVEILLQRARQFWIDAKMESAQPLLVEAARIAEESGDPRLRMLTNSRMANFFAALCRYTEAASFLRIAEEISDDADARTNATFYTLKGGLAAAFGNAREAFDYFDRAVSSTKENADVLHITSVWVVYGFWSAMLGSTDLAKSCYERALLVARQYHIGWRIPHLCLTYAILLVWIGQYGLAYEYLLNALAYNVHAPVMDTLLAEVGIPLALHMKDEQVLAKCVRPSALDFAFRSGEPGQIGPVASAFAQWHVASGRQREAQTILHRAVEILHGVEVDENWGCAITVARFGSYADIPKARKIIERRAAFPCADVANASLHLFDAFVAQRHARDFEMHRHAIEAAQQFEMLSLHGYADLARTLLPHVVKTSTFTASSVLPFADMSSVLSAREQQVAELVLKGLTNRKIAAELSITKNTVNSHVASIMNRLGIRSRYQLVDVFPRRA
jgi:ATP/maltotriose-dependent transcriptional regulator MalT